MSIPTRVTVVLALAAAALVGLVPAGGPSAARSGGRKVRDAEPAPEGAGSFRILECEVGAAVALMTEAGGRPPPTQNLMRASPDAAPVGRLRSTLYRQLDYCRSWLRFRFRFGKSAAQYVAQETAIIHIC